MVPGGLEAVQSDPSEARGTSIGRIAEIRVPELLEIVSFYRKKEPGVISSCQVKHLSFLLS